MAPTNKVTKSDPKTPRKSSSMKLSPSKPSPAKVAAAADENVRLLWLCLKGFLDEGQKINFQPVADEMGLTLGATKKRLERLKKAVNNAVETGQQQNLTESDDMDESKSESGEASPLRGRSRQASAFLMKGEDTEDD